MRLNDTKTCPNIVTRTQKIQSEGWLRDPKISRWEMPDYYTSNKEALNLVFFNVNYLQTLRPQAQAYDYALMLGGKLVQLWQEGIGHALLSL